MRTAFDPFNANFMNNSDSSPDRRKPTGAKSCLQLLARLYSDLDTVTLAPKRSTHLSDRPNQGAPQTSRFVSGVTGLEVLTSDSADLHERAAGQLW
jgi:hypothetical protein